MRKFIYKRADESPQFLEEVYKLRYLTYVKECHFLKDKECPEEKESDEFDPYSIHFVAIDDSNTPIGTVRLVVNSPLGFPLEAHCEESSLFINRDEIPRDKTAEISRLIISKKYRKRKDDGLYYGLSYEDKISPQSSFRRLQPMVFGLYKLIYQESKKRGITHWYAAMEDALFILLKSHGFTFRLIGRPIEYYGIVKPYLGIVEEIEKNVQEKRPDYYRYFTEGLSPELLPPSDIL